MNASSPGALPAAWRVAAVWALLSMVGVLLAMPFLLTLVDGLEPQKRPPLPLLMIGSVLQTGIISFFLSWIGTAAGRRLGVGSPIVEAYLSKQPVRFGKTLAWAALWGALGGLSVIALDAVFAPLMPAALRSLPQPTPFEGLLASFYGGISEEVLIRLGATTLFAWLVAKVVGFEGRPRTISLTSGVILGALLFGIGHLPLAFTIWPVSSVVVARILLLNALVGIVAGIVYVCRGLEHAVVLHFTADVVLYVLRPIAVGP